MAKQVVGVSSVAATESARWMANIIFLMALCLFSVDLFAINGDMGGGDGSEATPWLIQDVLDFHEFAGNSDYWDGYTRLECDPNLAGITYATAVIAPDTISGGNFDGTLFTGTFNGNNHTIMNLMIESDRANNCYLGLFGKVENCDIHNLGMVDPNIVGGRNSEYIGGMAGYIAYGSINNCYVTGNVSGADYSRDIGGLVGENDRGNIDNCYTTTRVNGKYTLGGLVGANIDGNISNCHTKGFVNGHENIGGLLGYNTSGNIRNCYTTGDVSGNKKLGGLIGWNANSHISNCYTTGNIHGGNSSSAIGGLAGQNSSFISNCYATGNVSGGFQSRHIGGLLGFHGIDNIKNCYATGSVTGSNDIGGLVGTNYLGGNIIRGYFLHPNDGGGPDNGLGEPLTDGQMRQQSSFSGWDFVGETANGTWEIWQMAAEGGYPVLSNFHGFIPPVLAGEGTKENPYQISNPNELGALYYYDRTAYFCLTKDIDLSGIHWLSTPIPSFYGYFDGNHYTISNLSVNSEDYVGLFSALNNGQITNLGLENVNITGSDYEVGGLVGYNKGIINNCYVTGSVNGIDEYGWIGGLVGNNLGLIRNCYTMVSVTGGDNSDELGGLVGMNNSFGSIQNCYANGNISGGLGSDSLGGLAGRNFNGKISNCYATGKVNGGFNSVGLGGLCGLNQENGVISSSFSLDPNNGGGPDNGLGIPLTDVEMRQQSSFSSWDFVGETANGTDDFWRMCEDGIHYPHLAWQYWGDVDFACPDGVEMADYAYFANRWLDGNCSETYNCAGADLNRSGTIDLQDFYLFCEQWLHE